MEYIYSVQTGRKLNDPKVAIVHLENFLRIVAKLSGSKAKCDLTVGLHTPNGDVKVNQLDDCSYVLHHLFSIILVSPNEDISNRYLKCTTFFIDSKCVSDKSKAFVVDFENQNFKDLFDSMFSINALSLPALESRMKLCGLALSKQNDDDFSDASAIRTVFSSYVSRSIEYFLNKGQFLQADFFLRSQLERSKSLTEKEVLVSRIVSHSTSFNLHSRSDLNSLIDDYEEVFESEDDLEYLKGLVNSDPGNMSVHGFSFFKRIVI